MRFDFGLAIAAVGFSLLAAAQDTAVNPTNLLGPDDQVAVRVADEEAIQDKPMRISTTGFITLPMVGRVHAAGMTPEQLEADLTLRFKKYIKDPQVSVTRMEIRTQPVSVLGEVKSPGVQQLQGRKSLAELLSAAGGVTETAGPSIRITREMEWGQIPLTNASTDASGKFSTADVPLQDILKASNPSENILVMPNDVITIPKADMVYVIGEVTKSGAIVLGGQERVTVLQAIGLAAGPTKTAKPQETKILRVTPGSAKRLEVAVDLKAILAGKAEDMAMKPEDILFVPSNTSRNVAIRAAEAMLTVGTGLALIAARP